VCANAKDLRKFGDRILAQVDRRRLTLQAQELPARAVRDAPVDGQYRLTLAFVETLRRDYFRDTLRDARVQIFFFHFGNENDGCLNLV